MLTVLSGHPTQYEWRFQSHVSNYWCGQSVITYTSISLLAPHVYALRSFSIRSAEGPAWLNL
jgi:hypothetical protein